MGYYTRFELEVKEKIDYDVDYKKEISEITDYGSCFDDEIKWYNYEKDMKKYSKQYPDTLFVLIGEGEEYGDIWKTYFKNGKMQKCNAQITYDEYDESKLT